MVWASLLLAVLAVLILLVVLGGAGVAIYAFMCRVHLGKTTYASVGRFIDSFSEETGLEGKRVGTSLFGRITDAAFTGESAGRRARLTLENMGQNNWTGESYDYARVAVSAPETPQFTVTVEGLTSKLGKAIGLKRDIDVGDKEFDDRFLVESLEPSRAKRVLERKATRETIETIFAHYGIERLECIRGEIAVIVPTSKLGPGDYRSLVERVAKVAEALDAQSVKVFQEAGAVSADARCGYCHEGAGLDDEDLIACELCHTVTHKACRAELGRCPVAGCAGSSPEHVQVRARS